MSHPNLILGLASPDDAGVYKLTDSLALIQTLDFFTPIVDDPYTFGQIAAANSLSDVYAKGGQPLTAMNIVCFPVKSMDLAVLKAILRGGAEKVLEAGALLVGGHSVEDEELKYGLSVTGTIHPERLVTNAGARPGDQLILTKPLGTGIVSTAIKAGMASEAVAAEAARSMAALNRTASELMQAVGAHAATDVTGFGLVGHAGMISQSSRVGIRILSSELPVFPEALSLARQGLCPGGLYRNREFYARSVVIDKGVPAELQDIIFDPQTSGGLLMSVAREKAGTLLQRLKEAGIAEAAVIGEVTSEAPGMISVA
jgi:selenide,water dikinase